MIDKNELAGYLGSFTDLGMTQECKRQLVEAVALMLPMMAKELASTWGRLTDADDKPKFSYGVTLDLSDEGKVGVKTVLTYSVRERLVEEEEIDFGQMVLGLEYDVVVDDEQEKSPRPKGTKKTAQ